MATPNDVAAEVFQEQFTKYMNVAALSAFLFDYCLTFSSEVHHVWGRKWVMARIVFTISRYLPFVASAMACYSVLYGNKVGISPCDGLWKSHGLTYPPQCGVYYYILDAISIVCVISAEVTLILRTYALWGRSRRVLAFLIPLVVAFVIAALVVGDMVKFSLPGDSESPYSESCSNASPVS
ncbi:hypothetical protein PAXRUDRAFT_754499 [Paxillus rubicundulus Ve08.2h10]|uniref:DUF6533 domain-containing protein n=1 Tax=Paxillus rubicundulus Ve08.2h10 TaxID=930991 RepID=A0A0D0D0J7_9AGAM|nr:hypothetical protein PAXRUDRAFT_754499 [Paxillus rubicundulus Ve08.2h10]